MRVLQICLKPPLPAKDGGCKAMHNITKGLLNEGVEVKVLTIATQKHPFVQTEMPDDYLKKTQIEHATIDTSVHVVDAFINLFGSSSYNIERFRDEQFTGLISKTLASNTYDIVLLESLFVTPYIQDIRANSRAKIVYRSHNVEYKIWERKSNQAKALKKSYLKLLTRRLKKYEMQVLNAVDTVLPITSTDEQVMRKMGCKVPMKVVPFGIDLAQYQIGDANSNTFFHIGSMDWQPNEEGISWLVRKTWPKVVQANPNAQLVLAGRHMPAWLVEQQEKSIHVIGEVEDALAFIKENGIMVVPLFTGSGMRVKIIEAMALGKLVISTSVGAEGITCTHGKDIVIANSIQEFTKAMSRYVGQSEERQTIVGNARHLIETNYDNRRIVNNLVTYFNQL